MSEFINTIDVLGDDAVIDSIIQRTITEFKDDRVTVLGRYAFRGCRELETIDLPNLADIWGKYIFADCTSLKSVSFPKLKTWRQTTNLFYGCTKLESVSLPLYTQVMNEWFRGCSSLKDVHMPKATIVGERGFDSCTALKYVDLPMVTSIGRFGFQNATSLVMLILRSEAMCALDNLNALENTPIASGTGYIYVPSALINSYKAASNWSTYAAQFRALEDYTVDGTITGELDETKI